MRFLVEGGGLEVHAKVPVACQPAFSCLSSRIVALQVDWNRNPVE